MYLKELLKLILPRFMPDGLAPLHDQELDLFTDEYLQMCNVYIKEWWHRWSVLLR